jgi:hypothetical protein
VAMIGGPCRMMGREVPPLSDVAVYLSVIYHILSTASGEFLFRRPYCDGTGV